MSLKNGIEQKIDFEFLSDPDDMIWFIQNFKSETNKKMPCFMKNISTAAMEVDGIISPRNDPENSGQLQKQC